MTNLEGGVHFVDGSKWPGLSLSSNALEGSVPPELGNLTRAFLLSFSNNPGLSGPIPDSFAYLRHQAAVGLRRTDLCIPETPALLAHPYWRERIFEGDYPCDRNRPPVAVGTLPDQRMTLWSVVELDLADAFADPEGDTLRYDVYTRDTPLLRTRVEGTILTLEARREGSSRYRVTALDAENLTAEQWFTVTVWRAEPFTDDPIVAGQTAVRAVHFTELRDHINALRIALSMMPVDWIDDPPASGAPERAAHLEGLRWALEGAYAAAGVPPPIWSDEARSGSPIRAVHINELRRGIEGLEAPQ